MPESLGDRELVLGCLRGEQPSWEAFVERFAKLIHWSIRRTLEDSSFKGRRDLYEDIFQEFFKKLIERGELSRLREITNLRKFLSISAGNLALDRIKSLSRHESRVEIDPAMVPEDPGEGAAHRESLKTVQDLVEGLGDKERVCLELHYLDEKSHREIGEMLGMPPDTVSSVIRRTREKMRQKLTEKGWGRG